LKTFLLSKSFFPGLIGFLIIVFVAHPDHSSAQANRALSVKSELSSLYDVSLQIDSGIVDDDDIDEPAQLKSVNNLPVNNFSLFFQAAYSPQEKFTPDAPHSILIHCLKI
jgi:hypothetical protein